MSRLAGTILISALAGVVMAQGPFTIVRPADGSRVRETIHLMIPKGSVPYGAYVGLFAGGKFLKATAKPTEVKGKFDIYDINTKTLQIPDGPLALEAVLYQNYDGVTRVVSRSSVNVNLENSAAKWIPQDGVFLRYNWKPLARSTYDVTVRLNVESGNANDEKNGAIASEQSVDVQHIQMQYTCLDRYANGNGLVSMQAFPPKGQNQVLLQLEGDSAPKYYTTDQMTNIYMNLSSLGIPKWGSSPYGVSFQGSGASTNYLDLYADFPLPTLPYEKVKLGSTWPGRFLQGDLDMTNLLTTDKFVQTYPCQGQFLSVEWEMGHPCAKIELKNEQAVPPMEAAAAKAAGVDIALKKLQLDELVWFSLDTHQVIKVDRTQTVETKAETTSGSYGGGPTGGPAGGGPRAAGTAGGGGSSASANFQGPTGFNQSKNGKFGPGGGGGPMGGGQGSFGGFGRGGGSTSGGEASGGGFVRTTVEYIFVLEQ